MARKPLRTHVVTYGSSSQQASAHEKVSSSQQAPTHEKQAHHESLDVEEQLVVDVAVSSTLYVFNLIQRLILLILVDII